MRYHAAFFAFVLTVLTVPVYGQRGGGTFRANIRGNGNSDSGKCTVEVRVDGVAEVEFGGDQGRLRTLTGAPAQWTRIDCSAPMPNNMRDFRFSGVDGRGRQVLVADPRGNRGIAVVRIEDSKGGSEGYTFDLEWSGGSDRGGYGSGDGYGYGGGYGRDRDRDRGRDRDRDRNGGRGGYTINCASDDGRRRYCDADTRGGVQLLRQYGESCRQGETWRYDDRGIWVDRGCRGQFQLGR